MKSNNKLRHFFILIPLILSLFTWYRLIRPGYFSMQDDMQIFRLQQYDKCVQDNQFPCRYIPDGGLGYGYPLYNFYSPLPYAIAECFHLLGLNYIKSIKIVFILCHILAALGMFLFARFYWGNLGGLISSALFLFAPYRAIDGYVRGSIAELLALSLFSFVFWAISYYLNNFQKKYLYLSIFFISALFLSHNLFGLLLVPILSIYIITILVISKKINFKNLFVSFFPIAISFCLSAFFVLPAMFEKQFVTVDTMTQGYFNYIIHFVTLFQLFISRFWGYGASLWGPNDDMSFQIGQIQWVLPLIVLLLVFFKNKKNTNLKIKIILTLFGLIGLFAVFLTHNKSTFIWQTLPFMPYFQFPWRFLGIVIFCFSFISGALIIFLKNQKIKIIITSIVLVGAIVLNINYFKEDIWYSGLTDSQKLNQEEIIRQSGAGLKDYWPKYGMNFPIKFAPLQPIFDDNQTQVISYSKHSNKLFTEIKTNSKSVTVTLPLVYFPDWKLTINDKPSKYQLNKDLGLIEIFLNQEDSKIELTFINTPIRLISNTISLITLISLIIYLLIPSKLNVKNK